MTLLVERPQPPDEHPFEIGAMAARVTRHWRRHALNAIVCGALMAGITFLMPEWFRSTAAILPPEETEESFSGLSVQRFLSHMPTVEGLSNYYTPSDIFRAILLSRTVDQTVAERYGLQRVYRQKSMERTLKEFRRHMRVVLNADGTISVAVEDRDRARAADLANALVDELDRFNVERRNFQARRSRQFLEHRVAEIDSLSRLSEALLREYQVSHHVVAPLQESANVAPLADLMARRMDLEVQLSVLRSYLREDNERVMQTRSELEQLDRQISTLPALQNELTRLVRDVRLYQQAYSLLSVQLEDARLREVMDTPTVTVLDRAIPPERKARPIRSVWVLGAVALGALASVLWSERNAAVAAVPGRPRPA